MLYEPETPTKSIAVCVKIHSTRTVDSVQPRSPKILAVGPQRLIPHQTIDNGLRDCPGNSSWILMKKQTCLGDWYL